MDEIIKLNGKPQEVSVFELNFERKWKTKNGLSFNITEKDARKHGNTLNNTGRINEYFVQVLKRNEKTVSENLLLLGFQIPRWKSIKI